MKCAWTIPAALLLNAWARAAAPDAALEDLESLLSKPVYAASKYAEDAAAAAASVTVLTAGDIRAFGWRTLSEVLAGARGVATRDDRLYTYLGVRGFAPPGDYSSRVLLMIDGMRINENLYDSAVAGREFPIGVEMIERVELIAGPGSALYGSNAILAVVNVITKTHAELGGGGVTLGLAAQQARLLSLRQSTRLYGGTLVLAARVERRPGGDQQYAEYASADNPLGRVSGRDSERDRKLYLKWSAGPWNAAFIASDRVRDVPTGAYEVDFGAPALNVDRYVFGDLQWQADLAPGSRAYVRATVARYTYTSLSYYDGQVFSNDAAGQWISSEARWHYDGWRGHRLVLGVEGQRNLSQRQDAGYEDPALAEGTLRARSSGGRYALFANDDWTLLPNWRLGLGLRGDRLLNGQHQVTPRASLVWTPAPGLHLKLLQGRAFREPNAYESQYSDGVTVVANPNLGVERLSARELALDWRVAPQLRVAASLYRYRIRGLITVAENSEQNLLQYNNGGAALARGAELELDHVASNGWRTRVSWSGQRTRDALTHATLPNSPRSTSKLHVTGPLPGTSLRAGLDLQRIGQRLTERGEPPPAHTLANLTLQWLPSGQPWSASFTLYDLGNARPGDPAGAEHRQTVIEQDGRRWALQIDLGF
jgi:outer membrane receptor protein involved in Fe transport